MKIDIKQIEKLESLSMISLSNEERQKMIPELENMIAMINKLHQIDTEETEPLLQINIHEQTLREDKIGDMLDQKTAFKNTEHTKDVYFTVPKVINKKI